MDALNRVREPANDDYDTWELAPSPKPQPRRWCPSHRRLEVNPPGRLLCGVAWRDQYLLEQEVALSKMNPNEALVSVAEKLGELVEEMQGVYAPSPPPTPDRPPPMPRPPMVRARNGKGGVPL